MRHSLAEVGGAECESYDSQQQQQLVEVRRLSPVAGCRQWAANREAATSKFAYVNETLSSVSASQTQTNTQPLVSRLGPGEPETTTTIAARSTARNGNELQRHPIAHSSALRTPEARTETWRATSSLPAPVTCQARPRHLYEACRQQQHRQQRRLSIAKLGLILALVLASLDAFCCKSIDENPYNQLAAAKDANTNADAQTFQLSVDKLYPQITTLSPGEQLQRRTTLGILLTKLQTLNPFAPTKAPVTIAQLIASTTELPTTNPVNTTRADTIAPISNSSNEVEENYSATNENTSEDYNDSSARDADHDAEGCQGISTDESTQVKNLTDHERLVNLQSCLQGKVKRRLLSATRAGMEMFDRLALSGGCTASILNLMTSLGNIKSFAFKFFDASAKIPSGMMYGLLSDFGDFDQCMSIRSNPNVALEDEAEEGSYSGKYCLVSIKLKYHVELESNKSVPDGIIPDGIIWDDLVRQYWTSKTNPGFQIGLCLPSRCMNDDLDQIFRVVTTGYNMNVEVMSCQDGLDLKAQYTPDTVQRVILYCFNIIFAFTFIGTFIHRYGPKSLTDDNFDETNMSECTIFWRKTLVLVARTLLCFSIIRNWKLFMRRDHLGASQWDYLATISPLARQNSQVSRSAPSSSSSSQSSSLPMPPPQHPPPLLIATHQDDCEPEATSCAAQLNDADNYDPCESAPTVSADKYGQLTIRVQPDEHLDASCASPLRHLAGLRLFIILWITVGHSFLYPSANNYKYYRSIINMKITRDSVWFAATNFTLGIDMLLYISGLVFVYKLANFGSIAHKPGDRLSLKLDVEGRGILRLLARKILRFWPTYLTVIAIAIVVPLTSDGPMWPEMVNQRLGATCRKNWWTNLLVMNNFLNQSDICLPSSWFVSVVMQLFVVGSFVIVLSRKFSLKAALVALFLLLLTSIGASFEAAYSIDLRAPAIIMDESFVLDLDDKIFWLYTNIFNNLGPFVVGMGGGFLLVSTRLEQRFGSSSRLVASDRPAGKSSKIMNKICAIGSQIFVALVVGVVAVLVLSSVFHQHYTKVWRAVYWSTHRIGWAIVTGYIIHQCATGRWKLANDFLSLKTFAPLSKLIFIAYLVYPIFIHVHSGLVRDGLHVSIYNMLTIYTTRLVITFTTAALIHLLVELPFCSIEEIYLKKWLCWINQPFQCRDRSKNLPLLAVASCVDFGNAKSVSNGLHQAINVAAKNRLAADTNTDRNRQLQEEQEPINVDTEPAHQSIDTDAQAIK